MRHNCLGRDLGGLGGAAAEALPSLCTEFQRQYAKRIRLPCDCNNSMVMYYVHAEAGNDLAEGVSQSQPWRTLCRVRAQAWSPGLAPGAVVMLNSSSTFREGLYFDLARSSGS